MDENIKMDFKEAACAGGGGAVVLNHMAQDRQVASSCEYGNKLLRSMNGGDFFTS
jgi:hypothetical protein